MFAGRCDCIEGIVPAQAAKCLVAVPQYSRKC